MTLYEIDERILALVDPETGELLDAAAFDALQMEREAKLENIALWVKDLTAEADAIGNEIAAPTKRKQADKRKAVGLKEYLDYATGGQKFKTPRVAVSFRSTKAVSIEDEDAFVDLCQTCDRDDLLRYAKPSVNRTAVMEALEAGEHFEGVTLVTNRSTIIK